MSGLIRLTEQEKTEMLNDAANPERKAAFLAARTLSETGNLDDLIDFIDANIEYLPTSHRRIQAKNYVL